MTMAMSTGAPTMGFLFILLIVGAVALTLLLQGRWRIVLIGAIVALLLVGFVVPMKLQHRAETQELRARNSAIVQAQLELPGGAGLRIQTARSGPPPHRRLQAPDDVAAWKRDSTLGFRVGQPWKQEDDRQEDIRTMTRKAIDLGDTRFIYWEPSSNGKLVAFSEKEVTMDQAMESARDAAKRKLAALALAQLKADDPRFDAVAAESLAKRLAGRDDIQSWREEDAYQEWTTRPYGTLYRAAVCVKAEPRHIERLQIAVRREVASGALRREQEFRSWIVFTGAALLGGVIIFLVYTLVNAGTKGYFAWPLRGAALAFFAVLVLGALYVLRGGGPWSYPMEETLPSPSMYIPQAAPAAR